MLTTRNLRRFASTVPNKSVSPHTLACPWLSPASCTRPSLRVTLRDSQIRYATSLHAFTKVRRIGSRKNRIRRTRSSPRTRISRRPLDKKGLIVSTDSVATTDGVSEKPATDGVSEKQATIPGKLLARAKRLLRIRKCENKALPEEEDKQDTLVQRKDRKKEGKLLKLKYELHHNSIIQKKLPLDTSKIPKLHHGLERVLFNPGVYNLKDERSGVYNFDPYLENVMPVNEFDFDALPPFVSSSQDKRVIAEATKRNIKYSCSTSSISGALGQIHRVVSAAREIDFRDISKHFSPKPEPTIFYKAPTSILLRWLDGRYYVEADSAYNKENVLSRLGHPFERLLTKSTSDFEQYRKSSPGQVVETEQNSPSTYQFSVMGDLLIRSQLDAYDPRLPGSGVFDLKSRAVHPVRMNSSEYFKYTDYRLHQRQGEWVSFEREYSDMARSTLVKYMFQVRLGGMDGIFIAYHNTERVFGFQYMGLDEMDKLLHHDRSGKTGDASFKYCVALVQSLFERATTKFPGQSLRLHFNHNPHAKIDGSRTMHVFAEPISADRIAAIREAKTRQAQAYDKVLFGTRENIQVDLDNENEETDNKVEETDNKGDETDNKGDKTDNQKWSQELLKRASSEAATLEELYKHEGELVGYELRVESLAGNEPILRPKSSQVDKWKIRYGIKELKDALHWYGKCTARVQAASVVKQSASLFTNLDKIVARSRELNEMKDRNSKKLGRHVLTSSP